ncbi:MAG: DsrE/DsrF/DrsH-like family protein [Candidatus Omnitrophota bacterium]|nr:DsrE/DsrF/DrsH-like family protein [Candidatus Omnitrophota bacterium]
MKIVKTEKDGMALIFHSGSYDRIYHGLSIALAASALNREARCFFTYWALGYLRKDKNSDLQLDDEGKIRRALIRKGIEEGHILKVKELFSQLKAMGGKVYACSSSMGLLNISRDELGAEVDKSMGLTAFLTETKNYQILLI